MSTNDSFDVRRTSPERVSVDASGRRLAGRAISFNSFSNLMRHEEIGPFREVILPSAVDRVLSSGREVKALWDHNVSEVLGSRNAGTLTLNKTPRGLMIEIDPPSWASRHVESVERGDVNGMSFGFMVPHGGDDWDFRTGDGIPLHTVSDMIFREISITAFPAYEDTSVEVSQRSLELFLEQRPKGAVYHWRARFAEMMKRA